MVVVKTQENPNLNHHEGGSWGPRLLLRHGAETECLLPLPEWYLRVPLPQWGLSQGPLMALTGATTLQGATNLNAKTLCTRAVQSTQAHLHCHLGQEWLGETLVSSRGPGAQ